MGNRWCVTEGRSLSLEEVWNNVHPNYQQRLMQGPWDTITQQVGFPHGAPVIVSLLLLLCLLSEVVDLQSCVSYSKIENISHSQ